MPVLCNGYWIKLDCIGKQFGARERIRTPDPRSRNPMLYPTELRGRYVRKIDNKFLFVAAYFKIIRTKCGINLMRPIHFATICKII